MPPENDHDQAAASDKHATIKCSFKSLDAKAAKEKKVTERHGYKFRWLICAIAIIGTILGWIIFGPRFFSEARKANFRGIEKFGRHDYAGAIADYDAALDSPNATNKDKSASLYFMATAKKSLGDTNGAIAYYLELIHFESADLELRCSAEEDIAPLLLARAGKRFDEGDILGATEDYETLSSIENAPPNSRQK